MWLLSETSGVAFLLAISVVKNIDIWINSSLIFSHVVQPYQLISGLTSPDSSDFSQLKCLASQPEKLLLNVRECLKSSWEYTLNVKIKCRKHSWQEEIQGSFRANTDYIGPKTEMLKDHRLSQWLYKPSFRQWYIVDSWRSPSSSRLSDVH